VPSCRVRWFLWALVARIGCSCRERWRREGVGWVDQYILLRDAMEEWVFVAGLRGWVEASREAAGRVAEGMRRVMVGRC